MELYFHIPFCVKKCNYCDFLSGPAGESRQLAYMEALRREILNTKEGAGRQVSSIFIGGGTPSLLQPSLIASIVGTAEARFRVQADAEITIEANPGTLDREKLTAYRRMGVNRLSLGLQSHDGAILKTLGRIHTYGDFLESFALAREAGFDNINVDLMFALPGQTLPLWEETLKCTAELGPGHISAYSLIIEEGTPFAKEVPELPDEETEAAMYEKTAELLGQYGYRQYEISNYALPGRECRHNIGYWEREEYLGFGLGAASLFQETRWRNTPVMEEYLECSGSALIRRDVETLDLRDRMAEFMFLGLRMTRGVSRERFRECFGQSMEEIYGPALEKHLGLGLLERKEDRVCLTRRGIQISNQVMADFL